jgi:hypothetical protein
MEILRTSPIEVSDLRPKVSDPPIPTPPPPLPPPPRVGDRSELEPASKKSRKKWPPRVRDPPRFPHGTDAKTLVTLGPEKNVNLAHTYTLVGGGNPWSRGAVSELRSRSKSWSELTPQTPLPDPPDTPPGGPLPPLPRAHPGDGFGARTGFEKKSKKVASEGPGPSPFSPWHRCENIGHTWARKKR